MTTSTQKKYTKEELGYRNHSKIFDEKCEKCAHKERTKDKCKVLVDTDNDVVSTGWCKLFEEGKHILIDILTEDDDDQTPEEVLEQRQRFHHWLMQQKRKKILR